MYSYGRRGRVAAIAPGSLVGIASRRRAATQSGGPICARENDHGNQSRRSGGPLRHRHLGLVEQGIRGVGCGARGDARGGSGAGPRGRSADWDSCGGARRRRRRLPTGRRSRCAEGDTWSAATILKREGRKYQVRYAGGDPSTDEWVTADRLRAPGTAAGAAGDRPSRRPRLPQSRPRRAGKTPPAPAAAAPRPPRRSPPSTGRSAARAEVKWGGTYRKATIVNKRGEWYLINYENGPFEEWVEPWRIRKVGSADDPYGYAKPNPTVRKGQPSNPPSDRPGPRPSRRAAREVGRGPRPALVVRPATTSRSRTSTRRSPRPTAPASGKR